jgi:3-methyladenine DNA glycosylase AlkC
VCALRALYSLRAICLKDELFNADRVQYLAKLFRASNASFDDSGFVKATLQKLTTLELKERIVHIASTLESFLPTHFPTAAKSIVAALPPPLDPTRTDGDFGNFIFAPLGEFVVRNGLAKKHLRLSLKTLKAITQRFSMEDSMRAFINEHTFETLAELARWSADSNYHVRRLVSEATRPLLPWSGRINIDVTAPLPLLDTLHADPTRYVTRSVANHLNDVAKSHPSLVIKTLARWKKQDKQAAAELQWMSKHALRTLVKQGHKDALEFLGFPVNPKIEIGDFSIKAPHIHAGSALEFSVTITAQRSALLVVDYVIDFRKRDGSLVPKVFKLKQIQLDKDATITLQKRHPLRADATTYRLYPGIHHLALQINGKSFGQLSFDVRL